MNKYIRASFLGAACLLVFQGAGFAGEIDFSGLPAGTVVEKVRNGSGASGIPAGYVGIHGVRPGAGTAVNSAIIFDSTCPPGGVPSDCSGGDLDLGAPNENFGGPGRGVGGASGTYSNTTAQGNILIVAEDLVDRNGDSLVDDPDDSNEDDTFLEFDLRKLKRSRKGFTVNSITYLDNEEGEFNARILFFGPGTLNPSDIGITPVGDNGLNTVTPGIEGVTHFKVVLDGSGAVSSVVLGEPPERDCWVTTGGFNKGEISRLDASGPKYCTFGGNVGPPPSGAFEVNWHDTGDPQLDGARFHTNDIRVEYCEDRGSTGPGQPGGKKGLVEDTLVFSCDGKFNNSSGYSCEGYLLDGGEPAGKKGNDPDQIQLVVFNSSQQEVARCDGILSGGNVQIHPPVGKPL